MTILTSWRRRGDGFSVRGNFPGDPDYTRRILNAETSSLIAYLPMGEKSGAIANDLARGNNWAYVASPSFANVGIGDGNTAPLFNGTTQWVNPSAILAALDALLNKNEFTFFGWSKIGDVANWNDANPKTWLEFGTDVNNRFIFRKGAAINQLQWFFTTGGTNINYFATFSGAGWFSWAYTGSRSGNKIRSFLNGTQNGADGTFPANAWAGSLQNNLCGIAALAGSLFWPGYMAHVAIWAKALTINQIAALSTV